jgi:phage-related holin
MLVAGVVAAVANFLFAPMDILDVALLLVVIIAGIIGLLAGLGRAR